MENKGSEVSGGSDGGHPTDGRAANRSAASLTGPAEKPEAEGSWHLLQKKHWKSIHKKHIASKTRRVDGKEKPETGAVAELSERGGEPAGNGRPAGILILAGGGRAADAWANGDCGWPG